MRTHVDTIHPGEDDEVIAGYVEGHHRRTKRAASRPPI